MSKYCDKPMCMFLPDRNNRQGETCVSSRWYAVHYCAACQRHILAKTVVVRPMTEAEATQFRTAQDARWERMR